MVNYCNVTCQKAHWPKYKKECRNRASELKDEANFKAAIQRVANDTKSYVLPVSRLTGMLEAHVRFSNAQVEAEGNSPPQVVPFLCHDFTFEQFGVVARVLNRCYVDEDSLKKAYECLNYFGPFQVENLLVDLSLEPGTGDEKPPVKKQKEAVDTDMDEASGFDADIIVRENESRMKAVLSTARQFGEPYVPFKILFNEGMLQYFDGDDISFGDAFDVPMTAAATFLGDHNNLFALWCLDQYGPQKFTLEEAHTCSPFFGCAPESHNERLLNLDLGSKVDLFDSSYYTSWEIPFKVTCATKDGGTKEETVEAEEFLRGGMGLGLNVRVSDSELKSGLLEYMFNMSKRSGVNLWIFEMD